MKTNIIVIMSICLVLSGHTASAQTAGSIRIPAAGEKTRLNSGWYARRANEIRIDGNRLSSLPFDANGWMKAKVPGTVLTTLLENRVFPAPEFSMNNNLIPDIYDVGKDFYTFWFVRPFRVDGGKPGQQVWLNFRGINYGADIFLNGKRLNTVTHEGMFLRNTFLISPYLKTDGENLLAVIVYPPHYPGNPNGGQGGDGEIARNVTMQFTPGWDWIQPVRDRNTGIWDEVSITATGAVRVQHPYVVTKVPGVRQPRGDQKDAVARISAEVENTSDTVQKGMLICETAGSRLTQPLTLAPREKRQVAFRELTVKNPRLWWPNGIGRQELYDLQISFETDGATSDSRQLRYGIREISTGTSPETGGRIFYVNGQPIFITGGNYIASEWLLRLSPERYRAEVRFHAEMNVRMIRVWGGALLERPEFYDACDEFGLLVFQDLWGSGDCNGAWEDPMKLDSRERRWEYPDNHDLFLASVEDQVRMVRNHPSLCLWCGGNEWPLAKDIDEKLKFDVFPRLDPERLFVSYSTDTALIGRNKTGVGDGPYGIQEPEWFYVRHDPAFNPEAGSVGSPEVESMRMMMTESELAHTPQAGRTFNAAWRYHKDLGYGNHLERYGKVTDIETYCKYAQVVNYDQYRSFMEGWASHIWEWYTGILIWKTQNPWTSLRGQMYDYFLDVNASLYGVKKGCEPLHPSYNRVSRQVEIINTAPGQHAVTVGARIYDLSGAILWEKEAGASVSSASVERLFDVPLPEQVQGAYFLKLTLAEAGSESTDNIYWLTTVENDYTALAAMPRCTPEVQVTLEKSGDEHVGTVRMKAAGHISFFNRIKVFDRQTGDRILPVHYSDNYVTLMPGDRREIRLTFSSALPEDRIEIAIDSWTAGRLHFVQDDFVR
ncbi:MAG: beta-glycosidase [Tannerella sp.]|nr:beta-glycosidase [Tannerella sp.]